MHGTGAGQTSQRTFRTIRQASTGEPLLTDQDSGRLLLLRVWHSRTSLRPRRLLHRDGLRHDRRHSVSIKNGLTMFVLYIDVGSDYLDLAKKVALLFGPVC